jgi:hypothetical protein
LGSLYQPENNNGLLATSFTTFMNVGVRQAVDTVLVTIGLCHAAWVVVPANIEACISFPCSSAFTALWLLASERLCWLVCQLRDELTRQATCQC